MQYLLEQMKLYRDRIGNPTNAHVGRVAYPLISLHFPLKKKKQLFTCAPTLVISSTHWGISSR